MQEVKAFTAAELYADSEALAQLRAGTLAATHCGFMFISDMRPTKSGTFILNYHNLSHTPRFSWMGEFSSEIRANQTVYIFECV